MSASLPAAFANPAAYGDLIAAMLAVVAVALRARWSISILLIWIFNVWGAADFLLAFYNGFVVDLNFGMLGAAFFIPTVIVPAGLIIHALIFGFCFGAESNEQGFA